MLDLRFSWWYYEEFNSFQTSKYGNKQIFKNSELDCSFFMDIAGTHTPASVPNSGNKKRLDRLCYYSTSRTIIRQHSDCGLLGCDKNNM
jgi:hypothetical protein